MNIDFGARVDLADGTHVTVEDVIVDPYHLGVTHLALSGGSGPQPTRLVPVGDLVDEAETLQLQCDRDGFAHYTAMNEMSYVRIAEPIDSGPTWDAGVTDVLTLPYYNADFGVSHPIEQTVAWHRVPVGEVEIRQRSRVTTSDCFDVGHVEGFVTDDLRRVTHVVIDHRHLFGHRDLVIPFGDIDEISTDRVTLALSRDQVRDLPQATVRSWWDRHRPHRDTSESSSNDVPTPPASSTPQRSRTFHPHGLRPEHPQNEGIAVQDPDSAHDEACHLLADDAADTLMRDGMTRTEVWEWSEAFLAANGHGDVDDLVDWIRVRQRRDAPTSP